MSRGNRPPPKDMYWFAHGGPESEKNLLQRNSTLFDGEDEVNVSSSPTWNLASDRRGSPDEQKSSHSSKDMSHTVTDGGSNSSGPSSLERDDRLRTSDKRIAVEERRKQLWEAEQERNDAVLRKHMEREAALEARRNASRSNIAFAFGSSVPRNVETLHSNEGGDSDIMSRSFTSGSSNKEEPPNSFHDRRSVSPHNYSGHNIMVDGKSHQSISFQSCTSNSERRVLSPPNWLIGSGVLIGEDAMSRSMNASLSSAPRGRRKNDLMPTVPYDRTATPRAATSSSTRKRSVSMTRLDQLALPRKHYVEANKASSTASSANSSMHKDNVRSPTRPLSSASENSGGSGRIPSSVTRRVRSSPRKPRPISIAGTLPDQKQILNVKPFEGKASPVKRSYTPSKHVAVAQSIFKSSTPKSVEKLKQAPRPTVAPKLSSPKPTTPKSTKQADSKPSVAKQTSAPKTSTPKVKEKKSQPIKKKSDTVTASPFTGEMKNKSDDVEKPNESQPVAIDSDVAAENEKNNAKRIISEEEAKAALAEKRRLAREQAEREAELERQRQEELRLEEEECLRKEEEEHRKMEEEQMRLLEEHRRQEEEKLRKAIEDQEQKEEEERAKRDEDMRMKAEQERKAKEEAEKQRLELEEKLRKEEEERAERKKRLDKIMSRTRGKSSGTSPSGSVSGSDQLDSGENPQEGFSSGANSLDSNEAAELPSEQASVDDHKAEISSVGDSLEANPTYEIGSENESLNSNDLMMPLSETASQDNSLVIIPEKHLPIEDSAASSQSLVNEKDITLPVPHFSESEVAGFQESSTGYPEITGDTLNTGETWMAETEALTTTSAIAEPVNIHEVYDSNAPSEILQENQFQDNFESGKSPDTAVAMAVSEFTEINYDVSKLPEEVENQEDLGESDKLQMSSNKITANVVSEEIFNTKDELQSQPDTGLFLVEPSNTEQLPEDLNIDAAGHNTEILESQARSSISSDIKLPDPIYETSDDGSISSEKHQELREEFSYTRNEENTSALDDVFSQQVILPDPESTHHDENSFGVNALAEFSVQRSEVDFNESQSYVVNDSTCEDIDTNTLEQPGQVDEENVATSPSSISSIVEVNVQQSEMGVSEKDHSSLDQENKENITSGITSNNPASQFANQFTNDDISVMNAYDMSSDKENAFDPLKATKSDEGYGFEGNLLNSGPAGDNPFVGGQFQDNFESCAFQTDGDFSIIQQRFEQGVFENQTLGGNHSSKQQEVDDVTFIKADDSGACIGIISSIDHDQISNNFPKPSLHTEQLKNNFECASVTDSEDNSSLDSNLSQVMTVEDNEQDTVGGLNHIEISESNSSKNGYSNGEQHNPFDTKHIYNDSLSKTSVNNFHASDMFSNGHRFESSTPAAEQTGELHDYVQLGGNGILSVDHTKNNIFENVDAIDYSKVSPDPFLAKGNSNQISGNPFLLQDDQKQVLMAPEFLN